MTPADKSRHPDDHWALADDLVYRRTSPYHPDDPYTLIGEYLTLAYPGCCFVGFRPDGGAPVYIGISGKDQAYCKDQLDQVMSAPIEAMVDIEISAVAKEEILRSTTISETLRSSLSANGINLPLDAQLESRHGTILVMSGGDPVYEIELEERASGSRITLNPIVTARFYRQQKRVVRRQVILSRADFEKGMEAAKRERYWTPAFVKKDLEADFAKYIDALLNRTRIVVLFWDLDSAFNPIADQQKEHLVRAIINTVPVPNGPTPRFAAPKLPVDDIDVLRWFTTRFEATWHLQPNEQMGFLVLETQSRTQDRRAGQKLNFPGWLVYKYTGNLFVKSPTFVQQFLTEIERQLQSRYPAGQLPDEDARAIAKSIARAFLDKCFSVFAKKVVKSL